jgi:hypothetical protein
VKPQLANWLIVSIQLMDLMIFSLQDDGFDVCAIDTLDGLLNVSDDWATVDKPDYESESNPCPLGLTTLMTRNVVNTESVALKLAAASEGSSPELVASKPRPTILRPSLHLRRCQSLIDPPKRSPEQRKSASDLVDFTSPVSRMSFKRPAEPVGCDNLAKKSKHSSDDLPGCSGVIASRVCVINDTSNMTADGRSRLLLPTVPGSGKNRDLNNVDCHSVADLIRGKFDDQVRTLFIELPGHLSQKEWYFSVTRPYLPSA